MNCPEAKVYEAYSWCKLSGNICIRNTGNERFDTECPSWKDGEEGGRIMASLNKVMIIGVREVALGSQVMLPIAVFSLPLQLA